jgi:hypothetical protein
MSITYDVFARKEHAEPLAQIGSVEVENSADVVEVSLAAYGPDSNWLEMLAVPRQEVVLVFSEYREPDQ